MCVYYLCDIYLQSLGIFECLCNTLDPIAPASSHETLFAAISGPIAIVELSGTVKKAKHSINLDI